MTEGIICIFLCIVPPGSVVDSYAQNCRIIQPSRKDTPKTLRQIATENARCRAARKRRK